LFAKSTLPNMLDVHPPFQIDGNFGGGAGIIEMLMQSHAGEVHLLPALPMAWLDGEVSGLRARGGFEIDMAWEGGEVTNLKVKSLLGNELNIRIDDQVYVLKMVKGQVVGLVDLK